MSDLFMNVAFVGFAGLAVIGAVLVVAFRNLLHAAVALFFSLAGIAGLYVLIGADFLGVTQLLVYAGGILVLIIFGVFMTAKIYEKKVDLKGRRLPELAGLGLGGAFFLLICSVIVKTDWPTRELTYEPTVAGLGDLFLTKYLLPFELISVLLLFAMIGAVLLVHKEVEGS